MKIEADVPLAPLTTLGVGGPARHFARARTPDDARELLAWARDRELPLFVLGQGSNVVFSDQGFPGLVLQLDLVGSHWQRQGDRARVVAAAGETWDALVAESVTRGCSGIECLSGIPGRLGAAPIQNVGAYGQEVGRRIVRVEAIDARTLAPVTLEAAACRFGYRTSFFKTDEAGRRLVILGVELELDATGQPEIRYEELARQLAAARVSQATPADLRAAVLALRRAKSMLADAHDPLSRSAGSFFLNPRLSPAERARAEERARACGALAERDSLPGFVEADGRLKVPAAWLIERAGFPRGCRRGAVGLSAHHALAIVNYGAARAQDVVALAREIRDGVRTRFGIVLTPEPVLVGLSIE